MPEASAHAVQSTSAVYIIFDIGRTWRHMSASVRRDPVGSSHNTLYDEPFQNFQTSFQTGFFLP